jgi:hypothetical protein
MPQRSGWIPLPKYASVADLDDADHVPLDLATGRGNAEKLTGMCCVDMRAGHDGVLALDVLDFGNLLIAPRLNHVADVVLEGDLIA